MLGIVASLLLAAAPDAGALLSRPVTATADHMLALAKEHRVIYTGHAKAVRDSTTLTCDELEIHITPGQDEVTRIIARGNVEAVDGRRWARGEQAVYENATGVLVVQGHPRAREGKREVWGDEVRFSTGSDTLLVTKAHTRLEDERSADAQKRIAIDSDTMTLENAKSKAVWSGHVRARRGPTLLLAPLLAADYEEGGAVSRVQASGGVEVFERDRWAKGQRADYDAKTGVMVMTGRPEARQGKSHLRGTRVVFTSGSDVIDVENVTSVIDAQRRKPEPGKKD